MRESRGGLPSFCLRPLLLLLLPRLPPLCHLDARRPTRWHVLDLRAAWPCVSIEREGEISKTETRIAISLRTVSRRAFLACAGGNTISANALICSGLGSGPPPPPLPPLVV